LSTGATIRLGEGRALSLSPDNQWALTLNLQQRSHLTLLPLGPGQPRRLEGDGVEYQWARYFPDGQRLLVAANPPGRPARLYIQKLDESKLVPLDPPVLLNYAVISQDGRQIAGVGANHKVVVIPSTGGTPREIVTPAMCIPVHWMAGGGALLVQQAEINPARIWRIDLATSRAELWKEISPPGSTVFALPAHFDAAADAYVYSHKRISSELYTVQGWL
jgi:hypothetical protein